MAIRIRFASSSFMPAPLCPRTPQMKPAGNATPCNNAPSPCPASSASPAPNPQEEMSSTCRNRMASCASSGKANRARSNRSKRGSPMPRVDSAATVGAESILRIPRPACRARARRIVVEVVLTNPIQPRIQTPGPLELLQLAPHRDEYFLTQIVHILVIHWNAPPPIDLPQHARQDQQSPPQLFPIRRPAPKRRPHQLHVIDLVGAPW